jgi:hypothetical protein
LTGFESQKISPLGPATKSKYYVIACASLQSNTSKPTIPAWVEDRLQGPVLGDPEKDGTIWDKSKQLTAQWWNEIGIIHEFKLDREPVVVKNQTP